jgi:dihydroorotate dehydrogenase (fumarate)
MIENRVIQIVKSVRSRLKLPLAVKISPFYAALPNLIREFEVAGADGAVLFTRVYQSDFNAFSRSTASHLQLSQITSHAELLLRLRWMALLSPWTKLSLALSGGVHTGLDAIKGIMAGSHAIQVVSALLNVGPSYINSLVQQLENEMRRTKAESIAELRGCLNSAKEKDAGAAEREDYFKTLHSWPAHQGSKSFL